MHSIYATIVAAGLATFAHAQAYTKPTEATWGPLLTPDLSNPVTQGKDFTVTWDPESHPTDGVTVSLVLCHGPSTNCVPADTAIATGLSAAAKSYDWKVPCDLAPGTQSTDTGYGMMIIVESTGEFQYSTQFSVLENKACGGSSGSSGSSSPTASASSVPISTASDGSIILGPPAYATGSLTWSGSDNSTHPTTYTGTGSGWATATVTGSASYSYGYSSVLGSTDMGGSMSTVSTIPAGTTVPAGGATQTASGGAATASAFGGGANQVGWNAAGVVVAGAVALFAL